MIKAMFLSASCFAANVPAVRAAELSIAFADAGPAITAASKRLGDHLDWGAAVCGEPKYLKTVCVWELGSKFSLTANTLGESTRASMLITRWRKPDQSDASEIKAFRLACNALVAALQPNWSPQRVNQFANRLRGKMHTDHEIRDSGVRFAFYTWPEMLTCEAQPDG
ncbi:hypothetical protein [Methylobacterium crusticola]|nr:hypothetical protein [Methylobacterium crusticola]